MDHKIGAPGDGLPPLERIVANAMLGTYARLASDSFIHRHIRTEVGRIIVLVQPVSEEAGRKRILIPRPTGIEDGSRDWSMYMTVQHLVIVNDLIRRIVETLTDEQRYDETVRIEDVKPDPDTGAECIEPFQSGIEEYLSVAMDTRRDLRTAVTHAHPWFGELDARTWHCLFAIHLTIHRRQISKIDAVLRSLSGRTTYP